MENEKNNLPHTTEYGKGSSSAELNNQNKRKERPFKAIGNLPKNLLATIILISFIVGASAGGVAGLITGGLNSGSLNNWLTNPLGILNRNQQNSSDQLNNNSNTQIQQQVIDTEEATTMAVSKVVPAVVSIIISKELLQNSNDLGSGFPFDNFFNSPFEEFFFGSQPQNPPPLSEKNPPSAPEKQQVGGGTGFIISADGLILTNKHVVVDTAAEYSVVLNDGTSYEAKVIDRDSLNDLAILKIEANSLPTVTLGDSDKVQIGQTVIAIGYSLGEYSNSVTKGIISGQGRDVVAGGGGQSEVLEDVFQTDAAINPGNSGGPLINLQGEVIGINTAINREGQLVGFAIPVNAAKSVVESVKEYGRIVRAYLGVRYVIITEQLKKKNNLGVDYGVLIVRGDSAEELAVIPGSPADKAGLTENDIILEIDGIKLGTNNSLAKEVAKKKPGDVVALKILHDGKEKQVSVSLSEYQD